MGRSVSTPPYCECCAYQEVDGIETGWEYDDWLQDIAGIARENWPSFDTCTEWLGNEDRALLENKFVYFGVSEYCGLAAVWLACKGGTEYEALASNWIASVSAKFKDTFGTLDKLGTMSNGESVYTKKEKKETN